MNHRQDGDDYWNQSLIGEHKFNFDDASSGIDKNATKLFTAAQFPEDVRSKFYINLEQDNDAILIDNASSPSSSNLNVQSARYRPVGADQKPDDDAKVKNLKSSGATELAKLEAEVEHLRRSLNESVRGKLSTLDPRQFIMKFLIGEYYPLEGYKGKEEKISLLQCALDTHDGNVIIAVVLHLKNTLKKSLFHRELMGSPDAMNHYLVHLNAHQEYSELLDILAMLGKTEEAAILSYKLALKSRQLRSKVSCLKSCYTNHFQVHPGLSIEAKLVQEHISLLETQIPIEAADAKAQSDGVTEIFQRIPRSSSLLNSSLITTLYYCCLYHYELPENRSASPQFFRKTYGLTDRQFVWTGISARARLKQWDDIDVLLSTKNWFGTAKWKFVIPPEKLLAVLNKNQAGPEILIKYISKVDNAQLKLKLAKRYGCHKLVVDILVAMRDRQQLQTYKNNVAQQSSDYFYIQDALKSSTIRWKN